MKRPNVRITPTSSQDEACPLVHIVDGVAVMEQKDPGHWTVCDEMFDRVEDVRMCSQWMAHDVDEPATCLVCLGGTP